MRTPARQAHGAAYAERATTAASPGRVAATSAHSAQPAHARRAVWELLNWLHVQVLPAGAIVGLPRGSW
ncbi:hypothetical protein [Mycobacterium tuberculosis]|nr:hypothetical protein [Mycobacterium tuberculosis]